MVDCSYDIPLLKSLELLLTTSVVQEQVLSVYSSQIFYNPSSLYEYTIF